MLKNSNLVVLLLSFFLSALSGKAVLAETPDVLQAEGEVGETGSYQGDGDPLGRSTPRGTVVEFLKAIDFGDTSTAADYLDLRNLPPRIQQYSPEQLAMGLSIVLQRSTWIDLERLSNRVDGLTEDDLPPYRDLLAELPTAQKPVRVLLQRVPDGQGGRNSS